VAYLVYTPEGQPEQSPKRKAKRDAAIGRTYERDRQKENCEQYVLKARNSGWYPVLKKKQIVATDSIWLNKDEVWRYGKTCLTELGRYPGRIYYVDAKWTLTDKNLSYEIEFNGSETDCLVKEKEKIYNYPLLPECLIRGRKLIRPAGCIYDN